MPVFRIPVATYRIQFNRHFRFQDACHLVPYLHRLGITDLYASPLFQARAGSPHGYDVADPERVNPELGSEKDFQKLIEELRRNQMGLLLDIVPNHMAATSENPWWMDVLENGRSSAFADFFDINWKAAKDSKILLPVLGHEYTTVLQNQELTLGLDDTRPVVNYYENKFPLEPKSCTVLLEGCLARLHNQTDTRLTLLREITSLIELLSQLPPHFSVEPAQVKDRQQRVVVFKARFAELCYSSPQFQDSFQKILLNINGKKNHPETFSLLDRLLAAQPYRLAYWRTALQRINYRRFFDITHLIGLRVEDPRVFAARHEQILELVKNGSVTGLRIDHVDGLYDPLGYLRRLQESIASSETSDKQQFYVLVEKILGRDENLPRHWPVAGTTGYDFLNVLNRVLLDPSGLKQIEGVYASFTGIRAKFFDVVCQRKKQVIRQLFHAELNNLVKSLEYLTCQDGRAARISSKELTEALIELTAWLPVYRTYIRSQRISQRDRNYLKYALRLAQNNTPRKRVSPKVWSFLRRFFLHQPRAGRIQGRREWIMRWQQFSGPVMAKGLEDTACYTQNSLLSLNEVGTDPVRHNTATGIAPFHRFIKQRAHVWPYTLNATATHDTKRGQDARMRLNVLSEFPQEWNSRCQRWRDWNRAHKQQVRGRLVPEANEEILLYQTFLSAWPFEPVDVSKLCKRLTQFMIKAAREAKTNTSWLDRDEEYESALIYFINAVLAPSNQRFLDDLSSFQKQLSFYGALNSLSQLVVKIAAPGVPDFYQGTEFWDLSLVDPDNRQPVDFTLRLRSLNELENEEKISRPALLTNLVNSIEDGRLKHYLLWKGLTSRRLYTRIFLNGVYIPLETFGRYHTNLLAFARRWKNSYAVAVVPRLLTKLTSPGHVPLGEAGWKDTFVRLPARAPLHWRNCFTGDIHTLERKNKAAALSTASLFRQLPVALIIARAETKSQRMSPDSPGAFDAGIHLWINS